MTFSICAYDSETGQVGVGALTGTLGVGKLVSHTQARVGAAATQATTNPYLALDGIEFMRTGKSAQEALDEVLAKDDGREYRQVGFVDVHGRTAAWTGNKTQGWAGHLAQGTAIAQGNRLVGPETLEATLEAFWAHQHLVLGHRLLHALEAGEATGGDTAGTVSGNITVMDSEAYPLWDVRVDKAENPVAELRKLVEEFDENLMPTIVKLSTRQDYVGQLTREMMAQDKD
jgi:uncharacterized Ntn-hydrolase superfamily protein